MDARDVGLCGWNGSQRSYFQDFHCIEIQSTFYDPPSTLAAAEWRAAAPTHFQFCMKAWQLITHPASSPTYRRLRKPVPVEERGLFGSFQPTEQVWEAWQRTLSIAQAVEARVVLFQCPKSFLPTSANLTNFASFFARLDRADFQLAWEPRGDAWTDDVIHDLCAEYDLIHCVDPFEATSVHGDRLYWRLHGRGSYAYRYTDHDLEHLAQLLQNQTKPAFVMFNNFSSKVDALRFKQLLGTPTVNSPRPAV